MVQNHQEFHRIIGYFAYTRSGSVFCEGDACVIADSEELMKTYLSKMPLQERGEDFIIKKTRFGEVINGLKQRGPYAFDEGSYKRFLNLAELNGMNFLPIEDTALEGSHLGIRFTIVQSLC